MTSHTGAAFLAAVNLAYKFHHGMGYEVDVYLTYDADSGSRRAPDTAPPPPPEGGGLYAYLLFATPVAMAAVMMLGYTRAARATLPGTPSGSPPPHKEPYGMRLIPHCHRVIIALKHLLNP